MNGVRRVRVHVPAKDGWPEMVRGIGSEVVCVKCGERCRARSHAEARKQLRMHTLMEHTQPLVPTTYSFLDESGETRLRGTIVPAPGFTPVTCVLEAYPLDVHAPSTVPFKWTHLFNNPGDFTPLVAIPTGLGLSFVFDGTSETVTMTTAGTWVFTLGMNVPQDATWAGFVTLDGATYAGANCPVPPAGQSANVLMSETVTVPAGYVIGPNVLTTAAAAANPLTADVYLTVVRIG